jgi:hypothetical protein
MGALPLKSQRILCPWHLLPAILDSEVVAARGREEEIDRPCPPAIGDGGVNSGLRIRGVVARVGSCVLSNTVPLLVSMPFTASTSCCVTWGAPTSKTLYGQPNGVSAALARCWQDVGNMHCGIGAAEADQPDTQAGYTHPRTPCGCDSLDGVPSRAGGGCLANECPCRCGDARLGQHPFGKRDVNWQKATKATEDNRQGDYDDTGVGSAGHGRVMARAATPRCATRHRRQLGRG